MPASRFARSALLCVALASSACSAAPATTPGPSAAAPATSALPNGGTAYAALGASETYGVGAEPVGAGYAYLVRDAIHAVRFANAGIPGATLNDAYETELTSVLALRPTVCTVFFGVNDVRASVSREAFLATLHDLLVTLQRSGAQVLVIGLPELEQLPAVAALHLPGVQTITSSWNAGMAAAASSTGSAFLSLAAFSAEVAAHPDEVAADGLHPSTLGHARLAAVITAALRADHLVGA